MLPTTPQFFCFLLVLFIAYWLTRRVRLAPVLLIGAANLFFYAKWGWIYLALMPAAAACDFLIGRALAKSAHKPVRRLLVTVSICLNIGLIVLCRYVPFLTGAGWVLPLSLSFYAFQAMSYTIDIYRNEIKPTNGSYFTYFASVNFFPTVLAGPITRVAALVPQWNKQPEALAPEDGSRAFFLIGLGLAKKFLIADYLGTNLVNRVFDLPALYSGGDVLVAVYGYAFQLYYDFSGYTDIAIGSALLLGIKLPANFNAPYSSRQHRRFLEALAHHTLEMAHRIPVFLSAGETLEMGTIRQFHHHDGDRRLVARRQLDFPDLGIAARLRLGVLSRLASVARQKTNRRAVVANRA